MRDAIAAAARRLAAASETARLDAELLMAHALGVERDALLFGDPDRPSPAAFAGLVERRLAHEPIAYIIGRRDFWTIRLGVGPGVLIPRPDSETLIEAALDHFGEAGPHTILDLGTGPGTLLLAALAQWPHARALGVDASADALAYAERNAVALGLADRAAFRQGDWVEGVEGRFDLILCNPPYVESGAALPPDVADWEPAGALYAGADGLAAYRRLAPLIGPLLAPGGIACIEIGAGQCDAVSALFAAEGFTIKTRTDLRGVVRTLILALDRD
ncbi:peptide chain release factor N(5)-glutamine methyltransferase [Sphingosinicella sp.]|uniref:peptide chain release factor N(5)-glutamine methyltransferase n=1 Tax=Sphingosinicella sp. TaxID=1917971 RepID=UPI004038080B